MKFKYHIGLKLFCAILGIISLFIIGLFIVIINLGGPPKELILGIIFFAIISIIANTTFVFSWLETYNEYFIIKFYGMDFGQKFNYNDILSISDFLFGATTIEIIYKNRNMSKFIAPIQNRFNFYKKILESNHQCVVSPKIEKLMKKKYGKDFFKKLEVKN